MPRRNPRTRRHPRPQQDDAGFSLATVFGARKGKLSSGLIAVSSAMIFAVYTIGRTNSSAGSDELLFAPTTVASVATNSEPTVAAPAGSSQPTSTAIATTYRDGSYTGSGNSRHGGMDVTVVVSGGKIVSANVVSCHTRYSCSDVDLLVEETVSAQKVPVHYVSGATDSSDAYNQAVANALAQAT